MKKPMMKKTVVKKAPVKKTPVKKSANKPAAGIAQPTAYREPKSVRITKAGNGLTISSYGPKGEQIMVAKNEAEAMRHCRKMLK